MGHHDTSLSRVAVLQERVEELTEELRQLREILNPPGHLPAEWGLTLREAQMLHAIARGNGSPVHRERVGWFVYGTQYHDRCAKIFDVMLCKIRRKTAARGLEIGTITGLGWYMSPEDCQTVRGYFERSN